MKTTIKDINVKGKTILLRVDFNVPQDEKGQIIDDNRIMESLATINYLTEQGAKVIACSHLGRPNGIDPKLTLRPVAERLSQLIKAPVVFATDTVGKDAKEKAKALKSGEVLLLENLRFNPGEDKNDPKFAKELSLLADIYVNDAFGTAHREHASTYGVANLLPNAVGFLMGKEIKVINSILSEPKRPFVAILGGSKIKDKIQVIENLLRVVDTLIIGGGMAYTFIKAQGGSIGKSLLDGTNIDFAKRMLDEAKKKGVKVLLPYDTIAAKEFSNSAKRKKFLTAAIPDDYQGLDIGPKTTKMFIKEIKGAGTIIWNGPVGVYEFSNFANGTLKVAKAVSKCNGFTFIGGGDSAAAVIRLGYAKRIDHISTGGGASLMMLEGKTLPGVDVIRDVEDMIVPKKAAKKAPAKAAAKKAK
ncbi:MAG: phosphoglycerate kinase [Christensenellaceae bacterium]|jgi:phosphoglycerate kinase|nr:phosphoglycerate kinase [Christensenellaceae bacterium]